MVFGLGLRLSRLVPAPEWLFVTVEQGEARLGLAPYWRAYRLHVRTESKLEEVVEVRARTPTDKRHLPVNTEPDDSGESHKEVGDLNGTDVTNDGVAPSARLKSDYSIPAPPQQDSAVGVPNVGTGNASSRASNGAGGDACPVRLCPSDGHCIIELEGSTYSSSCSRVNGDLPLR